MEKQELKPTGVFKYFAEICQVPRPSKKEEKIIAYLKAFGEKHKLETKVDEAGNVLIKKPATPGMENRKTVVLQSHIDMVCEKNNDVKHDFLTDPIETEIDGEWLKAKGTTLGADNGIGVATELAILADDSIQHGPLECLFTVDEETGLTGAFALKEGFMNGDILLNLDTEDEGELFVGGAGGIDSVAEFTYKEVDVPAGYYCCKVQVKGFPSHLLLPLFLEIYNQLFYFFFNFFQFILKILLFFAYESISILLRFRFVSSRFFLFFCFYFSFSENIYYNCFVKSIYF
mgnify:CR=1 FL=1